MSLFASIAAIRGFRNKNQFCKNFFEVILISEFMNSEIITTFTLKPFSYSGRFHFEKPLLFLYC